VLRLTFCLAVLLLISCGPSQPPVTINDLVRDYTYTILSHFPSWATQAGYHNHPGKTLDDSLEVYSERELNEVRQFLEQFEKRMAGSIDPEKLDPQQRADYDVLRLHVQQLRFDLDIAQSYKHNPTLYIELVGNAVFNLFTLDFAPLEQRYDAIIARLGKVSSLVEQARVNLTDAPDIWAKTAVEENVGNHEMLILTLKNACPPSRRVAYDTASGIAMTHLDQFDTYLEKELSKRPSDWRLGKEKFARKFQATLGLNLTPDQVLADAEQQLQSVRARMFGISKPLYAKFFPGQPSSNLNTVIRKTLERISERHGTAKSYMSDAKRDLEEARQFVKAKNLAALPTSANLQVIETPGFMRGIYSVGGFNPAPPLEPKLGAFYWLTPIPPEWPDARKESKLREYNFYGLKLLTIHEAIPGHYLQFEYANSIESKNRRLLRAVFGNGPYVEGWAVYATETMLDEGYLNSDPALRLVFLKQQLRMIANAILDIRMHTMNMTEEEAMRLMLDQTFQEKEEAAGKLTRVKLSSVQLCTYFTGWREWRKLREKVQQAQGASFNLAEFHGKALHAGAVPMPALERIMLAK
jgi:uncharacterized protein (DUF885 family)